MSGTGRIRSRDKEDEELIEHLTSENSKLKAANAALSEKNKQQGELLAKKKRENTNLKAMAANAASRAKGSASAHQTTNPAVHHIEVLPSATHRPAHPPSPVHAPPPPVAATTTSADSNLLELARSYKAR